MKKSAYFIIQIIWSLIISSVVWYLTLKNVKFDFYHNSDDSLSGMFFCIGSAIYIILTFVQIVVGIKKVKEWRWWIVPVSMLTAAAAAFLGLCVVVYGTEFLNNVFSLGL